MRISRGLFFTPLPNLSVISGSDVSDYHNIVVCDSGFGGLDIAGRLLNSMYRRGVMGPRGIRVTYFNAWPHERYGYNHLGHVEDKRLVFSNVMDGISRFEPDLCIFACNTLSVIYRTGGFIGRYPFRICDIVLPTSVELGKILDSDPSGAAVVVGTVTTIGSGYYQGELEKSGISADRMAFQACPYLSTMIEKGPRHQEVVKAIERYAVEAREKLACSNPSRLYLALCCTHYGYSTMIWRQVFEQVFGCEIRIVNPNGLFDYEELCGSGPFVPEVMFDVYSRVKLLPERIEAMSEVFASGVPTIANALRNYHYAPELFVAPDLL